MVNVLGYFNSIKVQLKHTTSGKAVLLSEFQFHKGRNEQRQYNVKSHATIKTIRKRA